MVEKGKPGAKRRIRTIKAVQREALLLGLLDRALRVRGWWTMVLNEALLGVVAGGVLTIAGAWMGARWQAAEARRVRQEQYDRDDHLRDQNLRRELYARFAHRADEGIMAGIGNNARVLTEIVGDLDRLCMEIELFGTPRVVAAAHYVVLATDNAVKEGDEGNSAIEVFLREARRELGLSTKGLPMVTTKWVRDRERIDWQQVVESHGTEDDE